MSVKDALTSAASRIMGVRPTVFFTSSEALEGDLTELVNAVARDIANSHDWRALTKPATLTGDGVCDSFSLPEDYSRMLKCSSLRLSSGQARSLLPCASPDEWLALQMSGTSGRTARWIIFAGRIHILPKPALGCQIRFFYQSGCFALDENGAPKARFDKDSDRFLIDEDLLALGLVWRYRQQKRMDYSDDQTHFEKSFNELAGADKGARLFVEGCAASRFNASAPYPEQLG